MSRSEYLAGLRGQAPLVLPSLLLCDFGNLEREIRNLEEAGVLALHLDVMDGNFVPNLTYGMPIVEAIRRTTDLALDVHLMIEQPLRYVEAFKQAGADLLTIHVEAVDDARPTLERIRELGMRAGVALNPSTPLERIESVTDACDLILVMSVEAGFGGQSFNATALDRLRELRGRLGDQVILEVDGGINDETIQACAEAGADWFVVGSGIFRQGDYSSAVRRLTDRAKVR
jgi:ribulose-phosphate 3-epimerase